MTSDELLSKALRYAERHAGADGFAHTPIRGLSIVRATQPSGLDHAVSRPLAAMVLQGDKRVSSGARSFDFSAGDSLLVTADAPIVSQIVRASAASPYISLILELDPAVIAELMVEMKVVAPGAAGGPVQVEPTDGEVLDAALRLVRLLERPAAAPVLQTQLLREMHYWLLAGRHGPAIRRLGGPESAAQRIARAVAILREEFDRTVPVRRLAAAAGMSPSSFHKHFRAVTSLSPLQFQKQLRMIEARRLMLTDGMSARSAAFAVGYESASQFTREYGRMFGRPPARDRRAAWEVSDAA